MNQKYLMSYRQRRIGDRYILINVKTNTIYEVNEFVFQYIDFVWKKNFNFSIEEIGFAFNIDQNEMYNICLEIERLLNFEVDQC